MTAMDTSVKRKQNAQSVLRLHRNRRKENDLYKPTNWNIL